MKNIILSFLLAFFFIGVNAQNEDCKRHEQIKARKIAIITEKLELTPEEAQKFWPLYNEYEEKLSKIHEKKRESHKNFEENKDNLTDEDYKKFADTYVDSKLEEAELTKEYKDKYCEILPAKKVVLLYHTEQMFKRELLKDIRGHHGKGGPQHRGGH
jgi:hypothetical protein